MIVIGEMMTSCAVRDDNDGYNDESDVTITVLINIMVMRS